LQGDNFVQYQQEFERSYNGNRAPLGIHLQAGMLLAFSEHQDQLNRFFDWALAHDNVWLVTISEVGQLFPLCLLSACPVDLPGVCATVHTLLCTWVTVLPLVAVALDGGVCPVQVLRWMKNPVSASQYQLECSRPTDIIGQACLPRPGGCGQVC